MDFYHDYAQTNPLSPLTPREHVRKRPGMYIGGTDQRALHHLIYIALDHLLEEAQIGRCTGIQVTLRSDNEVVISSIGLGVSVGQYKDTPFTTLEVLLQAVRISKRDLELGVYGEGGHTLGIGLAVLNPLCERLVVENRWDDALWRQSYAYGKPISALIRQAVTLPDPPGFRLTFRPDYTIFAAKAFALEVVEKRAQEIAFLTPGLPITVRDERVSPVHEQVYFYADGLRSLITEINAHAQPLHEPIYLSDTIKINRTPARADAVTIQIAFQFTDRDETYLQGYANSVLTPKGGTHLAALKAALLSALNAYLENDIYNFGEQRSLVWEEIADGLTAVVSIHHPFPIFVSPTTAQLANREIFGPIAGMVFSALSALPDQTLHALVRHHLRRRGSDNTSESRGL